MNGRVLPPLFGRALSLRACGRFVHVSADFGSDYSTHTHLSSEMLHAGLIREQSRKPRTFSGAMVGYNFTEDFDLIRWPLWCTVGVPINDNGAALLGKPRKLVDVHAFNSTLEATPGVQTNDKLPKFGSMETMLPGQRFDTLAISPHLNLLDGFKKDQVFWMGKKRTMFQITDVGDVLNGAWRHGSCESPVIQIGPTDVPLFETMQVLAATQRCLVVRGRLAGVDYLQVGVHTVPALALAPLLHTVAA